MTKLPDDDLKRSKHVGVVLSVLKCFKWKLYRCICWLIVEVILRNARCNDEIQRCNYFDLFNSNQLYMFRAMFSPIFRSISL